MAEKAKLTKALKAKQAGGPPKVTPEMKAQRRDEDIDGQASVLFEGCLMRFARAEQGECVKAELDMALECLRVRMALRTPHMPVSRLLPIPIFQAVSGTPISKAK
jgi:hypothetical protein